jgi:hypothetical protein
LGAFPFYGEYNFFISEHAPDPHVPKDLNHIFEWMHRMTTADPKVPAGFRIEPELLSSPERRLELTETVAALAKKLKLDVRIMTLESDPEYGTIKIVRPE